MGAYEIYCDECGWWKEGNNLKTICINCYNEVIKENLRLKRKLDKLLKNHTQTLRKENK